MSKKPEIDISKFKKAEQAYKNSGTEEEEEK